MTDDELDDLSHSAIDELLGCGLDRHTLLRYFKTIRNRATPAPAQPEGQKTGWPTGMLQDDDRKLSRALAATPHARAHADEAAQAIREGGTAAPVEGAAWQPIESVPGTEEPVLLWTRAGKVRVETGWYAKNLLEESKEDDFECSFTHWRPPLAGPESPTPAQEGKP